RPAGEVGRMPDGTSTAVGPPGSPGSSVSAASPARSTSTTGESYAAGNRGRRVAEPGVGVSEPPRSGADLALQSLLEPLDLAGGVDDRLLAREERVAVRADVDAELRSGRPDRPLEAAGAAGDLRFVVLGVDVRFHVKL